LPQRPATRFAASSHVAFGILLSRLTGLARERAIGYYFGVDSIVADALRQAIRIPNLLSNLFGEGVLSASFVTVYAKLRAQGSDAEARHLAAAVFGILSLICSLLVLVGVAATPLLIDLIAPGFKGEARILTIRLVRILFPGMGLLVLSAWCLGVLNSHGRFLLSYTAPMVSNITVIAILIWSGRHLKDERLVIPVAWAIVLGSGLQFLVQLPSVFKLLPAFRPVFDTASKHVRSVFRNFGPIFLSRGVVQISSYIDSMIASLLPVGAVAALGYGQVISILPISLFSMSVSAAELPAFSSATGSSEEVALFLRVRLFSGLRRIAFWIVPSAAAFLLLGDILVAALYQTQTGRFRHDDAVYVWAVLAGSAVGLLATALGRLYSSAFYALFDTRTPLRFALIRVVLTVTLGIPFALFLPRWIGIDPKWGVAGLTASAGIAGWVEFVLLRDGLGKRIGKTSLPASFTARLWIVAFTAGVLAYLIKLQVGTAHPILLASLALPLYGGVYFAGTAALGIDESRSTLKRLLALGRS
jgi:putative peptidoglycan lipid II flippase